MESGQPLSGARYSVGFCFYWFYRFVPKTAVVQILVWPGRDAYVCICTILRFDSADLQCLPAVLRLYLRAIFLFLGIRETIFWSNYFYLSVKEQRLISEQ